MAIKSKQLSNQLNQSQEIYPVLATVITQSQIQVQVKHSVTHLQDLIPTLAGKNTPAMSGLNLRYVSSRCHGSCLTYVGFHL